MACQKLEFPLCLMNEANNQLTTNVNALLPESLKNCNQNPENIHYIICIACTALVASPNILCLFLLHLLYINICKNKSSSLFVFSDKNTVCMHNHHFLIQMTHLITSFSTPLNKILVMPREKNI